MNWLIGKFRSQSGTSIPGQSISWEEWIEAAGSSDGYLREEAVKALGNSGDARALPVLLQRANDWVPQVRQGAAEAVASFLDQQHIDGWIDALPHLAALQRGARGDHASLLSRIKAFLSTPDALAHLAKAKGALTRDASRFVFSLDLDAITDDVPRLQALRNAVVSDDIVVARQAISAVSSLGLPNQRSALAGAACVSRFAPVRAAGLRAWLLFSQQTDMSLVRLMCRDNSPTVRSMAIKALTEGDRAQVLAQATQAFRGGNSARDRANALDLLCELEPDSAPAHCLAASSDPSAGVRRLAYARRLAMAGGAEKDELIAPVLEDPSPRVRILAVLQVSRGVAAPPLDVLERMRETHPQALWNLLSVASRLSPWERFMFLLEAISEIHSDPATVDRLLLELARWNSDTSRSFVVPSNRQAVDVAALWVRTRDKIPADIQRDVSFHLRTFGISE